MTTHKRKITVIGHKNPDTDSVCSAIAYAELKNRLGNTDLYVPRRAGAINAETRFVLKHFKVDVPELVEDVGTQVKDIEILRQQIADAFDAILGDKCAFEK